MRADDTPPDRPPDRRPHPIAPATPAEACIAALRRIAESAPPQAADPTALDPSAGPGLARVHRWYRSLLHHGAPLLRETDDDGGLLLRTAVGVVAIVTEPGRVVTVPADCCQVVNATLSSELVLRSEKRRTVLSAHSLLDEGRPAVVRHLLPGIRSHSLGTGTVLTLAVELQPGRAGS